MAAAERARPPEPPAEVYRGWDGKPVTSRCHAARDDAEGFKAALAAHQNALIGFENKMRTMYYRVPQKVATWLSGLAPERAVDIVARRLSALGNEGATLALVYDTGVSDGSYAVCVWLVSSRGIEAAETVPLASYTSFARGIETSLGVVTRAASRSPRPRRPARTRGTRALPANAAGTEASPAETLASVGARLLPPTIAARLLASRFDRLLILPAADLGTVPFAALPVGDRMLIDLATIVVLPDIEGLYLDQPSFPFGMRGRFPTSLVVGDPDLSRDADYEWVPLPGARREAEAAAKVGASVVLTGPDASRTAVLKRLGTNAPSLLYFATHGIADPVNPMDGSFLALTGGHLFARDIKKLRLGSRPLVVMSACQTGLGKVFEGGVFGLARAWLHAGARQVVMSLWNVSDEATERLMTDFVGGLRIKAPEVALHEAMLFARHREKDPALWAGFTIYGAPDPASR
ncbi:MAG: CHAT domain-containing protein [Pseudomonadota bacterium]